MSNHFKGFLVTAALAVMVLGQGSVLADQTNSSVAERGGGGGRGVGGYHGEAGHYDAGHPNYNRAEFNEHHENFNENHDNEFNREGWDHNNWEGAGVGGFGVDVVPPGEYVYPGAVPQGEYVYPGAATPTGTGDMNTLYQYESSQPAAPGN